MINKPTIFLTFFLLIVTFSGCGNSGRENFKDFKDFKENELTADSTGEFVDYKNAIFCVPSPQLINLYLKRLGNYPDKTIINPISNLERYSTTSKKALNLGVYGVDLGYINVYTVSENTNEYIRAISRLSADMGLGIIFTREIYDQIMALQSNQDSLAMFLSGLFSKADIYLKSNSQPQISALVITGGWVESFYLLCNTYKKQPSKELAALVFQQKFILENLIKILAPFYNSSDEMQLLIDDLVEMAYDFDVFDFRYEYKLPLYRYRKEVMVFENKVEILNANKSIDELFIEITQLRDKIIE